MKYAKILTVALAAVLLLAVFSGCAERRNLGDGTPLPEVTNPVTPPDVVDDFDNDFDNEPVTPAPGIDNSPIAPVNPADDISRHPDELDEFDRDDLDRNNPEPYVSGVEPYVSGHAADSIAAAMSADFSQIGALSREKDTGFPGGPVDEKNRPSGPVAYQQKYGKYDAHFIVPGSEKIYLTFDEGYENGYTSRILDILKEKEVKAVFFITYPYAQTEPALVNRIINEGHTLANHSTKHQSYPDLPLEEAAKDLMKLHDYVKAQYGYEMWLFRPPEGAFSEQTLALAQSLGYHTMLWSFAYKDYDVKNQPLPIEAESNVIKRAHPGAIMLLHAVSKTNSEILGSVIDTLRAKGFEFADYFYFH